MGQGKHPDDDGSDIGGGNAPAEPADENDNA